MKTCRLCEKKHMAKGLCRRHYYANARLTNSDFRAKANARALKYYYQKTEEERRQIRDKRKVRQHGLLDKIKEIVPYTCALSQLSNCDMSKPLCQDHDHSCNCGNYAGCSSCFRGFLCHHHNLRVLPIFEELKSEYIPELIKDYLNKRPLLNTGVEPLKYRG